VISMGYIQVTSQESADRGSGRREVCRPRFLAREASANRRWNPVSLAVEWTAMNPDIPDSLEEPVGDLRSRVLRLEEALLSYGILNQQTEDLSATHCDTASPAIPPASLPASEIEQEVVQPPAIAETPAARPLLGFSVPPTPEDNRSLESRIGSQWFNRVGILAALIGMAWFLKLAMDNHWIGPLGRVLIGLVAGAGLIAWSERFRSRGYPEAHVRGQFAVGANSRVTVDPVTRWIFSRKPEATWIVRPHVALHDRVAACKTVLFLQPLEDPLRCVLLLRRSLLVVVQNGVDHAQPRAQLGPLDRLLPLVAWRHRVLKYLPYPLPRKSKLPGYRSLTPSLDTNRTTYTTVFLHLEHPSGVPCDHVFKEIAYENKIRRRQTFAQPQSTAHAAHCSLVLHWHA
jgi:Predicted membrane protein (DUF2339)